MRNLLASILVFLVPTLAYSYDPCGQCEGKTIEQVHLHLVSGDQNADWYFINSGEAERDHYHKQICPNCKTLQYSMASPNAFVAILEQAAANCQQVKLITVVSHGGPGSVAIGPDYDHLGSFNAGVIATSVKPELSCAIAPDATLYFDGCNIARGCRGESFVTMLAGRLLQKGGTIKACYVKGDGITGFIGQDTICTNPHTLHVNDGLADPRWTAGPAPKTGAQCRKNMEQDVALLERLLYQKGDCNDIGGAVYAIQRVKESMKLEDSLGNNRTQFTDLEASEAVNLEDAYNRLDWWISSLQKKPSCAKPKTDCATCDATSGPTWTDKLRVLWNKL